MQKKICCFCGHRSIITNGLENIVEEILIKLIEEQGYDTFFSGSMGDFDKLCENVIRKLKRNYTNIRLCKVLAYYKHNIANVGNLFDEIIMPELDGIYYKRAITERNKWMVNKSDIVLCYVYKEYGGAFAMRSYAEKSNKAVINTI